MTKDSKLLLRATRNLRLNGYHSTSHWVKVGNAYVKQLNSGSYAELVPGENAVHIYDKREFYEDTRDGRQVNCACTV